MLKEVHNLAEFADKAADLNKSMRIDADQYSRKNTREGDQHETMLENPFACSK